MSGYQTDDGIRYAAVWTQGGDCQDARWEAFRDMTSTEYQVKASAQRSVSSVKNLAAETISLDAGDLGQAFRISRVSVTHNFNQSGISLACISAGADVTFMNGDILVLQVAPGIAVTVNDRQNGNISLRRPGYASAVGQPFLMDDHQYRLVLQYHSGAGRWVELQRNNLSPDYYRPTSVDEFFNGADRRYNSVWQAGKSQRTWRVTGKPGLGDNLDAFDIAVQTFMQQGGWKHLTWTDNTQGFTGNGSMTFTPPLDWTVATLPMLDEHPRYYVMIYSSTVPTATARIDRALPGGETTYSLGWDWSATQDTVRHTLRYQNRIGSLSVGSQIVGEISKAAASIGADAPTDTNSGLLTITNLVGGPFYPGEKLLIGNNVVATAAERDWMMDANMRHGGLLWGTRATLQHRSNGVNWSILFNQDNAYDPYWYLPDEGGINGAIWNLVDEFVAESKWPAFDLFGQYP